MKKQSRPAADSASLHPNRILHPHAGDLSVHAAGAVHPAAPAGARALFPALPSGQPGPGEHPPVTWVCHAPAAHEVFLAGDFNGWQPQVTPMTPQADGRWTVTLPVAPGPHEYRFVIDGRWQEDPQAAGSVPNPFGGCNSVVDVRWTARPQA